MASSTPRTPAPERPPPRVPVVTTPLSPLEPSPPPDATPSSPGDEYHTPPPSLGEASPREEKEAALTNDGSAADSSASTMSPPLSPVRLPSPHRLPPPDSHTDNNGQEGAGNAAALAPRARPQLRLATGLVRTPSQGSLAKTPSPSHGSLAKSPYPSPGSLAVSPSPSPSPSPPSPLTPTPAPAPAPAPALAAPNSKSGQATPKRAEARKPPASPVAAAIAVHFDPVEEAVTSPLRFGKPRLDHHQRAAAAGENGAAATTAVPPDVAAVAAVGERRVLSVTLRLATAVLSLVAFSLMASARTSGWAGDYYARHQQYRYAVAVNVIVCAYSIAQSFGEIRRLISPRFIYRSLSSYYFSLFLDQVLAYLLMSASSAAASRNDLWVSRFGSDPFTKRINSAVWLSFLAFLTLAANSLISTANLFSMV